MKYFHILGHFAFQNEANKIFCLVEIHTAMHAVSTFYKRKYFFNEINQLLQKTFSNVDVQLENIFIVLQYIDLFDLTLELQTVVICILYVECVSKEYIKLFQTFSVF